MRIRQINAFMAGNITADLNLGYGRSRVAAFNMQNDIPVVNQQIVSRLQGLKNFFMRQGHAFVVSRLRTHIQDKRLPLFQQNLVFPENADSQFWALHICKNGNKTAFFLFQLTDNLDPLFMLFMRAMAEINPKSVRTGVYQFFNLFTRSRRRSYGRKNFSMSILRHINFP